MMCLCFSETTVAVRSKRFLFWIVIYNISILFECDCLDSLYIYVKAQLNLVVSRDCEI